MNETPERICEALAWLYGAEWELSYAPSSVHLIFKNKHGDLVEWMDGAADIQDANNNSGFGVPINDRLAHALAVTAPWEWTGRYARVPSLSVESVCYRVGPDDTIENDRYTWMLSLVNGPTMQDSEFAEEAAKTAARTAYLTWMRGRFAMKGGVA